MIKRICLIISVYFVAVSITLHGSKILSDDEATLRRGWALLTDGHYKLAKDEFAQLANRGNSEAIHNCGVCAYYLDKEKTACELFKKSAEKGYDYSKYYLERLNLIENLLTPAMRLKIMERLGVKDFYAIKAVSREFSLLAVDPRFKNKFYPFLPNVSNLGKTIAKLSKGAFEIHFGDLDYPKAFSNKVPLIKPENIDFVKNGLTEEENKTAQHLAKILKNLDAEKLAAKTEEIKDSLAARRKEKEEKPDKFPGFNTFVSNLITANDRPLKIVSLDFIDSPGMPPLYMANSEENLNSLLRSVPCLNPLVYLDQNLEKSGIYASESLSFKEGFIISTSGNLGLIVNFINKDCFLGFNVLGNIWLYGSERINVDYLYITAGGFLKLDKFEIDAKKPEEMPLEIWNKLIQAPLLASILNSSRKREIIQTEQ